MIKGNTSFSDVDGMVVTGGFVSVGFVVGGVVVVVDVEVAPEFVPVFELEFVPDVVSAGLPVAMAPLAV